MNDALQRLVLHESEQTSLPSGWKWQRLEDVTILLKPGKLYDENSVSEEGEVPVVNQSPNSFHGFHNEEPGITASPERPVFTFANHTCSMRLMKRPYSSIQNVFSRVGKPGVADTAFLYYATLGRLSLSGYKGHHPIYRNQWIPLPSLSLQTRIASVLSAYDDLIENNRRRIWLLEEAAQVLYCKWFVNFRFPGHEHFKFIDGIPDGWQQLPASFVFEVNPKTTRTDDGVISYVPMAALSDTSMVINRNIVERRDKATSVRFRNGDTLFARITPCLENGKTGFVQLLAPDEVACGSTEFIVLRGRHVSNQFVYLTARQRAFRENAIKSMTGSSGRQRVQTSCFDRYRVNIPPKSIAKLFDASVKIMLEQIGCLDDQNEKLGQARDLLLPNLMNCEIAV